MQRVALLLHIDIVAEYSLVIIQSQKSAQCLFIAFADQVILVVPNCAKGPAETSDYDPRKSAFI